MIDVTTAKGNTEHLATVQVEITLIDSDSGEFVMFQGIGSGQDAGDKAVMKAQTAAIKYAYMMSLCIATGDDPEADAKTDENSGVEKTVKTTASIKNKKDPAVVSVNKAALCASCGEKIMSDRVVKYSTEKYGKALCMDCQKMAGKVA